MAIKRHVKNYLEAHGYTVADVILCEKCGAVAVDIHHIHGRKIPDADNAENLIALCRKCHSKAHGIEIIED